MRVSHPRRCLRHAHTRLWQACAPCRQKLRQGLLGRPGEGPRCHLQRPLAFLRHRDERDRRDDIQPVRPHARSTLPCFAPTPPNSTQELLRRDYGDFGQATARQGEELVARFQSAPIVSSSTLVYH